MASRNQGHLARFGPAIKHSWQGLKVAYQHEIAFRQEVFLSVVLIPLAWFLSESFLEFVALISGMFLILVAELLNSGIEAAIDRISDEHHELSGRAKDLGSAAVMVAIIYFVLVWAYFIVQRLS